MKANEIEIEKIVCDDAGIQEHGHKMIPTDCMPSKGDIIRLDGVKFECTHKEIEIENGMAAVTMK
jgi:hypothetical protein